MKIELTGYKGDPNDCYARALPDEPLFTLLARDPQAPQLVRKWANDRESAFNPDPVWDASSIDPNKVDLKLPDIHGVWKTPSNPDADMIAHARYLAARMEVWRYEHEGEWRKPKSAVVIPDPAPLDYNDRTRKELDAGRHPKANGF